MRRHAVGTPYNKPLNQTDSLSSWERSPPRKLRTRIERRARLELYGVDWLYFREAPPAKSAGYGLIRYAAQPRAELI